MQISVCSSLVFRKVQVRIIYSCMEFEVKIVVLSRIGLNGEDAVKQIVILMTLFSDIVI